MSLGGILIGFINCVIVAVVLVLVGAIIAWIAAAFQWPIPWNIQRLYLAVVALVTLVCVISLLLGSPMVHIIHISSAPRVNATPVAAVVDSPTRVAVVPLLRLTGRL